MIYGKNVRMFLLQVFLLTSLRLFCVLWHSIISENILYYGCESIVIEPPVVLQVGSGLYIINSNTL
jgi:hypothetical protein